jgi:hypothetical protein
MEIMLIKSGKNYFLLGCLQKLRIYPYNLIQIILSKGLRN